MKERSLLERITTDPKIFADKPIILDRRLMAEHVLGMMAAEGFPETIRERHSWLEMEDPSLLVVRPHWGDNLTQRVTNGS